MRKFLVFDVDRSLSSIGGPERQREVFGLPPIPISRGVDQVIYYLGKMIAKEEVQEEHELFGTLPGETRYVLNEKARQLGLTGIMIDTLSVLGLQTRERLMQERRAANMDLQLWGIYGDKMLRFVSMLSQLEIPVIITSHIERDRDENGGPMDIIGVKGAAKLDTARFFDVIAYSRVDRDTKGNVTFGWQTVGDARRILAKNRGDFLPPFMEQNVGTVLDAYEREGNTKPKILILGDAGQGKTYSLGTINQGAEELLPANGQS